MMKKMLAMAGWVAMAMMAWGGEKVAMIQVADGGTLAKSVMKLGEITGNQALGVMAATQVSKQPWNGFFGPMRQDSAMSVICFADEKYEDMEGLAIIYPVAVDKENFKARHEVEETQEGVMRLKGNPLGFDCDKLGEEVWVKFSEDGKWAVTSDTLERMYASFEELERAAKSMDGDWMRVTALPKGMETAIGQLRELVAKEEDEEEKRLGEKLLKAVESFEGFAVGSKVSDLGIEFSARATANCELPDEGGFAAAEMMQGEAVMSIAEISGVSGEEVVQAWEKFAQACSEKGAPVKEILDMKAEGNDCVMTVKMNRIVELASEDTEKLEGMDDALDDLSEDEWLKTWLNGIGVGRVGEVHKFALELDNYHPKHSAANRLAKVIPEVNGRRISEAGTVSMTAIVQSLAGVYRAAAGEGLDEETAQILAMLPEETEGGLAYAKWREGREMRWICRISADELRALSNAVMMIWMSRMSGMDGLTFPGGI